MIRIALAFAFLFAACNTLASERVFEIVPPDGQQVVYQDGAGYLIQSREQFAVIMGYVPESKKRAWLSIVFRNLSTGPLTISEKSITAKSNDLPLKVYSFAELAKEQKRREMWQEVGAGFAAAGNNMSANNAGNEYQQGTYQSQTKASVYGNGGSAYGTAKTNGSYSGTSYNATAAQIAQAEANRKNDEIFANTRANADAARSTLQNRALKANTIASGQDIYGEVSIDLPKKSIKAPVEFVVQFQAANDLVEVRFREVQ
jgi:hypothetical protein